MSLDKYNEQSDQQFCLSMEANSVKMELFNEIHEGSGCRVRCGVKYKLVSYSWYSQVLTVSVQSDLVHRLLMRFMTHILNDNYS